MYASSIGAAAVHEELLHLAAALGADDHLGDVAGDAGEDQAVAVLRGMEVQEVLDQSLDEAVVPSVLLPLRELLEGDDEYVALGPGHFLGASADESPALVAAVEAEHGHHFLHDLVFVDLPPLL